MDAKESGEGSMDGGLGRMDGKSRDETRKGTRDETRKGTREERRKGTREERRNGGFGRNGEGSK